MMATSRHKSPETLLGYVREAEVFRDIQRICPNRFKTCMGERTYVPTFIQSGQQHAMS